MTTLYNLKNVDRGLSCAQVGDWLHVTVEDGTSGHVSHSWARVERVTTRVLFTRRGSYSIATGVAYSAGSAGGCVVVRVEIVSAPGLCARMESNR